MNWSNIWSSALKPALVFSGKVAGGVIVGMITQGAVLAGASAVNDMIDKSKKKKLEEVKTQQEKVAA